MTIHGELRPRIVALATKMISGKRDIERDAEPSEGGSPPSKKTNKSEKTSEPPCVCICCKKPANKDSIQYEYCHEWEHYQCAGISKNAYKMLGNSRPNVMFFLPT